MLVNIISNHHSNVFFLFSCIGIRIGIPIKRCFKYLFKRLCGTSLNNQIYLAVLETSTAHKTKFKQSLEGEQMKITMSLLEKMNIEML